MWHVAWTSAVTQMCTGRRSRASSQNANKERQRQSACGGACSAAARQSSRAGRSILPRAVGGGAHCRTCWLWHCSAVRGAEVTPTHSRPDLLFIVIESRHVSARRQGKSMCFWHPPRHHLLHLLICTLQIRDFQVTTVLASPEAYTQPASEPDKRRTRSAEAASAGSGAINANTAIDDTSATRAPLAEVQASLDNLPSVDTPAPANAASRSPSPVHSAHEPCHVSPAAQPHSSPPDPTTEASEALVSQGERPRSLQRTSERRSEGTGSAHSTRLSQQSTFSPLPAWGGRRQRPGVAVVAAAPADPAPSAAGAQAAAPAMVGATAARAAADDLPDFAMPEASKADADCSETALDAEPCAAAAPPAFCPAVGDIADITSPAAVVPAPASASSPVAACQVCATSAQLDPAAQSATPQVSSPAPSPDAPQRCSLSSLSSAESLPRPSVRFENAARAAQPANHAPLGWRQTACMQQLQDWQRGRGLADASTAVGLTSADAECTDTRSLPRPTYAPALAVQDVQAPHSQPVAWTGRASDTASDSASEAASSDAEGSHAKTEEACLDTASSTTASEASELSNVSEAADEAPPAPAAPTPAVPAQLVVDVRRPNSTLASSDDGGLQRWTRLQARALVQAPVQAARGSGADSAPAARARVSARAVLQPGPIEVAGSAPRARTSARAALQAARVPETTTAIAAHESDAAQAQSASPASGQRAAMPASGASIPLSCKRDDALMSSLPPLLEAIEQLAASPSEYDAPDSPAAPANASAVVSERKAPPAHQTAESPLPMPAAAAGKRSAASDTPAAPLLSPVAASPQPLPGSPASLAAMRGSAHQAGDGRAARSSELAVPFPHEQAAEAGFELCSEPLVAHAGSPMLPRLSTASEDAHAAQTPSAPPAAAHADERACQSSQSGPVSSARCSPRETTASHASGAPAVDAAQLATAPPVASKSALDEAADDRSPSAESARASSKSQRKSAGALASASRRHSCPSSTPEPSPADAVGEMRADWKRMRARVTSRISHACSNALFDRGGRVSMTPGSTAPAGAERSALRTSKRPSQAAWPARTRPSSLAQQSLHRTAARLAAPAMRAPPLPPSARASAVPHASAAARASAAQRSHAALRREAVHELLLPQQEMPEGEDDFTVLLQHTGPLPPMAESPAESASLGADVAPSADAQPSAQAPGLAPLARPSAADEPASPAASDGTQVELEEEDEELSPMMQLLLACDQVRNLHIDLAFG